MVDYYFIQIRNQIVKLLEDPSFVIEKEMNVVIKFTFNSEGEIVVLCAGCKDKQVVNYIRKNLNGKKFDSPGVKDKIYKMPLKIKVAWDQHPVRKNSSQLGLSFFLDLIVGRFRIATSEKLNEYTYCICIFVEN